MSIPLNEIICGDNVSTMATFPEACIDLVVTSPPYDNLRTYGGHSFDFECVAQQLWRVIKPGGVVVWIVGDATIDGSETGTSFRQALRFKEIGFRLHDTMIWDKGWCQYGDTATRYVGAWEYVFVFSRGAPNAINIIRDKVNVAAGTVRTTRTDRRVSGDELRAPRSVQHVVATHGSRSAIWTIAANANVTEINGKSHPAPFPESLARDHILSWSNEGDIVLDPFAGSFTTCKMARLLGRRWIGIEINELYCEIGRKRLSEPLLPFMSSTGRLST